MINILGECGNKLRKPYSEHLEDGIFELRAKVGSDISRVLCFFCYRQTNCFNKWFSLCVGIKTIECYCRNNRLSNHHTKRKFF